jgi:phosphoribosyl-ATP pyrophosphohydrolase
MSDDPLDRLEATISARRAAAPDDSYTAQLFARGRPRIAQKLGEEAVEAAIAAPDERAALDLAETAGERDHAARIATALHAWTRDLLVAQEAGDNIGMVSPLSSMASSISSTLAARVSSVPAAALLSQASLCADVIEALEQNGNGRLQIERLLLGMRELRGG